MLTSFSWQELIILAVIGLWLWMLVDCLRRDFRDSTTKLIWALVIICLNFIGALIYLAVGRSQGTLPGAQSADTG